MRLPKVPLSRFFIIAMWSLFCTLASAGQQQESAIYSFRGGMDGSVPGTYAGLVADSSGTLYGTTYEGGGSASCGSAHGHPIGCGTVFQLVPSSAGGGPWTEQVLYAFQGKTDGSQPISPLAIDGSGNLYGTTMTGGAQNDGTVFELSPPAVSGGAWTFTVLYNYPTGEDGAGPNPNGVILDAAGNLYSEDFGVPNTYGSVFELSPTPSGPWTYTLLYAFTGQGDGAWPRGNMVFDTRGNLYGATMFGGQSCPATECGTVFKLNKPATPGGAWTEAILYTFTGGDDGGQPYGGVVFYKDSLYGTTELYGSGGGGTAFQLSPPQSSGGAWALSTIFSFDPSTSGSSPLSPVIFDDKGNLYGVSGGLSFTGSQVYEISPPAVSGGAWTFQNLYTFSSCAYGCNASAHLTFDLTRRNLFGMAQSGGRYSRGVVFEVVR
jgi:uncharacterized repeat protein (TIGR03803 family)